MTYDWYRLMSLNDFIDGELPSISEDFTLPSLGKKTILFTKGNLYSMVYEGVFLTMGLNDKLPFEFEGLACFCDVENYVWLGIEHED